MMYVWYKYFFITKHWTWMFCGGKLRSKCLI